MLMSLNGKAPQLFPFQRGEGGSIPSISIVRNDVKLRSFYFLPQASLSGWPFVL